VAVGTCQSRAYSITGHFAATAANFFIVLFMDTDTESERKLSWTEREHIKLLRKGYNPYRPGQNQYYTRIKEIREQAKTDVLTAQRRSHKNQMENFVSGRKPVSWKQAYAIMRRVTLTLRRRWGDKTVDTIKSPTAFSILVGGRYHSFLDREHFPEYASAYTGREYHKVTDVHYNTRSGSINVQISGFYRRWFYVPKKFYNFKKVRGRSTRYPKYGDTVTLVGYGGTNFKIVHWDMHPASDADPYDGDMADEYNAGYSRASYAPDADQARIKAEVEAKERAKVDAIISRERIQLLLDRKD